MNRVVRVALLLSGVVFGSCANCPREGCDALAAASTGTGGAGIAGVVASESDVIANGCQKCLFGSTQLTIWKASSAVTDNASAAALVHSSVAPTVSLSANGRYEQALDPGSYLVCSRPDCVAVEVSANRVTTVHVKLVEGPPQFVLFDGEGRAQENVSTFEVGL
jgi:hypothetical protein